MGISLEVVNERLPEITRDLFEDPSVRSVGIGSDQKKGFAIFVVRNSAAEVASSASILERVKQRYKGIPFVVRDTPGELEHLLRTGDSGRRGVSPLASSVPERTVVLPLCMGLQIQNIDNDVRTGGLQNVSPVFCSLGAFVKLPDNTIALLSTNHVIAAENHGVNGTDRILRPGAFSFQSARHIATLTDFVNIRPSPANASVTAGTAFLNRVDASVSRLLDGLAFNQAFHPTRGLAAPIGVGTARVDDEVFKVGRSTELTRGKITSVTTTVGPIQYTDGPSWFDGSITVEGLDGTPFSDHGDSGAALVNAAGQIVGILYAMKDSLTYACPIEDIFQAFGCTLA